MSCNRNKSESAVKCSAFKDCGPNKTVISNSGKVLRVQAKWNHNWYEPKLKSAEYRVIIRGPFNKPLLVSSTPYALTEFTRKQCKRRKGHGNSEKEEDEVITHGKRAATLRTGIPDPWAEYLIFGALPAACKRIHPKELYLWSDNIQLSETVWKQYSIPLEQGIPDPWITWPKGAGWHGIEEENLIQVSSDDLNNSSSGNCNRIRSSCDITDFHHIYANKQTKKSKSLHKTADSHNRNLICEVGHHHYVCPSEKKQNNFQDCSFCKKTDTKQQTKTINVCNKACVHETNCRDRLTTKICKSRKPKRDCPRTKICSVQITPCQEEVEQFCQSDPRKKIKICQRTENKNIHISNSDPEIGNQVNYQRLPFAKRNSCGISTGVPRSFNSSNIHPKMICQCCTSKIDVCRKTASCSNCCRSTQERKCLVYSCSASNIEYHINCECCSSNKCEIERDTPCPISICPSERKLQSCQRPPCSKKRANTKTKCDIQKSNPCSKSQQICLHISKDCSSQNRIPRCSSNKAHTQCPALKNHECSRSCTARSDKQCPNKFNTCRTVNNKCQQCSNRTINCPAQSKNCEPETSVYQSKNLNRCKGNQTNACTGVEFPYCYTFSNQPCFTNLAAPNCDTTNCDTVTKCETVKTNCKLPTTVQPYCYPSLNTELSCRKERPRFKCMPKKRKLFKIPSIRKYKYPNCQSNGTIPLSCNSPYYLYPLPNCNNEPSCQLPYFYPNSGCFFTSPGDCEYPNGSTRINQPLCMPPKTSCMPIKPSCMPKPLCSPPSCSFTSPGNCQYTDTPTCIKKRQCMPVKSSCNPEQSCMPKPACISAPHCSFTSPGNCQYTVLPSCIEKPQCMPQKPFCKPAPSWMPMPACISAPPCSFTSPGNCQHTDMPTCIKKPQCMPPKSSCEPEPSCMPMPACTSAPPCLLPCSVISPENCQHTDMTTCIKIPHCMPLKSSCNPEKAPCKPKPACSSPPPCLLPPCKQQRSQFYPCVNYQKFSPCPDINYGSPPVSCPSQFSCFQTQKCPCQTQSSKTCCSCTQTCCSCNDITTFQCSAIPDPQPQCSLTVCSSSIRYVTAQHSCPIEIPLAHSCSDKNQCQCENSCSINSLSPCQSDSKISEQDCCNGCQCSNNENKETCRKFAKSSRKIHKQLDCPIQLCICSAAQCFTLVDKHGNKFQSSENKNNGRTQYLDDVSSQKETTINRSQNTNKIRRSLHSQRKSDLNEPTIDPSQNKNRSRHQERFSKPKETSNGSIFGRRKYSGAPNQHERKISFPNTTTRRISNPEDSMSQIVSFQRSNSKQSHDVDDVSDEEKEEETEINTGASNPYFSLLRAQTTDDNSHSVLYNIFNKPGFEKRESMGKKSMPETIEKNNAKENKTITGLDESSKRPSIAPSEFTESSDSGEKADESDETRSVTNMPMENPVSSLTFLKVMEDKFIIAPKVRPKRESKKYRRDSVLVLNARRNSRLAGGHCSPNPSAEISRLEGNSESLVISNSKGNHHLTKRSKSEVGGRTKELVTVKEVEIQEIMKPNKKKELTKNKKTEPKKCTIKKSEEIVHENDVTKKRKSCTSNILIHNNIHNPSEHFADSSAQLRKKDVNKMAVRKGGSKDKTKFENTQLNVFEHYNTKELETIMATTSSKGNRLDGKKKKHNVKESNNSQIFSHSNIPSFHNRVEKIKMDNKDISLVNLCDVEKAESIIIANHNKKDSSFMSIKRDAIQNNISVTDNQTHIVENVYIDDDALLFTTCLEGTNDLLDVVVIPKTTKITSENKSEPDQGVCMNATEIVYLDTTKENGTNDVDLINLCSSLLVESTKDIQDFHSSKENLLTFERSFYEINTSKYQNVQTCLETQNHIGIRKNSDGKLEINGANHLLKNASLQSSKTENFKGATPEFSSRNSTIYSAYDLIPYNPSNFELESLNSELDKEVDKFLEPRQEEQNNEILKCCESTQFNLNTLDEFIATSETFLVDKYLSDESQSAMNDYDLTSNNNVHLETKRRESIRGDETQPSYRNITSKIVSHIGRKQRINRRTSNSNVNSLPNFNVSKKRSISATSVKRYIQNGLRRANKRKMRMNNLQCRPVKADDVIFSISERNNKWFEEMSTEDPIIDINFDYTDYCRKD